MICKDSFVKIMDELRDYNDKLDVMYRELGINMDNNTFTKILDCTLDALVEDVEPNFDDGAQEMPWCYYYAFECNWGRNKKAKERSLTSAAELYDLLTENWLYPLGVVI